VQVSISNWPQFVAGVTALMQQPDVQQQLQVLRGMSAFLCSRFTEGSSSCGCSLALSPESKAETRSNAFVV
jgi:hypothetical protein